MPKATRRNTDGITIASLFLAVAREENITRAAESLHITQPSLSKQLMELEQELGKQLFIRGKRKITLTEEGVLLRKRADEILMLCEKTRREIAQDSDLIGGVISIGGAQSTVVAQATSLIADRYPGVKFQFFNGDAETLMERLDHGTLDFSILIEPVDLVKYEHLPLNETDEWGLLMQKIALLHPKKSFVQRTFKVFRSFCLSVLACRGSFPLGQGFQWSS